MPENFVCRSANALYNHALSVVVVGIVVSIFDCTSILTTVLKIKTSYKYASVSPIYEHQIFSNFNVLFLNGSHFGTFIGTVMGASYCILISGRSRISRRGGCAPVRGVWTSDVGSFQ